MRWIVSPRFDLGWFFGGALLSLAVLGLVLGAGVSIVPLFWIWLLAFDGPHIGAAFTRTYFDRQEWKRRPGMLLLSLLTFAIGPLFLVLNVVTGSPDPFLLFLGLATFYGYYHVVRQHWGFVALYKARNGDYDKTDLFVDRLALYVGCWAPYVWFLFQHPRARALVPLPSGAWERVVIWLTLAAWGLALAAFLVRQVVRPRTAPRTPQVIYLLTTTLLYSLVYFFVSRYEPVYGASTGPDQDFMLLSVLVVVVHNLQYLGLVWFHNRNRYAATADFGAAGAINGSLPRYLATCLVFSGAVYLLFAAWTGVFPVLHFGAGMRWGPVTMNQIGLCLWWGLAINHYYLDQKIWRIRGDAELKKNLGLA